MADYVQCFMLESTSQFCRILRRFTWSKTGFTCEGGYHNALVNTGETEDLPREMYDSCTDPIWTMQDKRWPTKCSNCDYEFTPEDPRQHRLERLFRRVDTGKLLTLEAAPVGAMRYADWFHRLGPDGHGLLIKLPGKGLKWWSPEQRAPNCNRVTDDEHFCWCRHGTPPFITINKTPEAGHTTCDCCGELVIYGWHGSLKNGRLIAG